MRFFAVEIWCPVRTMRPAKQSAHTTLGITQEPKAVETLSQADKGMPLALPYRPAGEPNMVWPLNSGAGVHNFRPQ